MIIMVLSAVATLVAAATAAASESSNVAADTNVRTMTFWATATNEGCVGPDRKPAP